MGLNRCIQTEIDIRPDCHSKMPLSHFDRSNLVGLTARKATVSNLIPSHSLLSGNLQQYCRRREPGQPRPEGVGFTALREPFHVKPARTGAIRQRRQRAKIVGHSILAILAFVTLAVSTTHAGETFPVQFQYKNFRVQSQEATEKILPAVQALPALQGSIAHTLDLEIDETVIDVRIFSSGYEYRKYIRPRVPNAASRPALFVKGPDRLYVYVVYGNGWETNLRHEVTHATLHSALPYLAIWIDEGLAKYFEVPKEKRGYHEGLLNNLRWRLRFGNDIRTKELEEINDLTEMDPEHYRDSWAWVYFCLHAHRDSRKLFQEYLREIQDEQVVDSLFERLHRLFPRLQETARYYFL